MSKTKMVLEWLQEGKVITNWTAFREFGITRLSSVIHSLRKQGHKIDMEMVAGTDRWGNDIRYGEYRLEKKKELL
jgi:hypothetical protein